MTNELFSDPRTRRSAERARKISNDGSRERRSDSLTHRQNIAKNPRNSDIRSYRSRANRRFTDFFRFPALFRCFGWIYKKYRQVRELAAEHRLAYREEETYTVADIDPDDEDTITTTNLPVLFVLSSPGSPISALVGAIADSYKWYTFNIGALLQHEMEMDLEIQAAVAHLMHRGIVLPRAFIFEIIRRQMANVCKRQQHKGFIFTDFPVTFSQTKDFFNNIVKPDFILYFRFSEKMAHENLAIYLRFQVRASKVLRKLQPDIYAVATEQFKKFKREIQRINLKFGDRFKIIDTTQTVEELCKDIMKWIERAAVLHNIVPPLFIEPPLPKNIY